MFIVVTITTFYYRSISKRRWKRGWFWGCLCSRSKK